MREYFFYVDHHGRLFQVLLKRSSENVKLIQDDSRMFHWTAALKEEKLLFNFFKRLKFNTTDRYPEFRYVFLYDHCSMSFKSFIRFLSLCGKERNFVRCDDRPIVFHNSRILPTPSGIVATNIMYCSQNFSVKVTLGISCTIMLVKSWLSYSNLIWSQWFPAQVMKHLVTNVRSVQCVQGLIFFPYRPSVSP